MTRKEALTDLLAKVEANKPVYARDEEIGLDWDQRGHLMRAVNGGSLDAAKALHEAVLPGWIYVENVRRGQRNTCNIAKKFDQQPVSAVANCPARAWLIAILKALIAECEE